MVTEQAADGTQSPRGRDSIEDREGLLLPRAFCPEGHMHRKSRALASLLLSPGLPSPPPLPPSLPCSTSVSPTQASLQKGGAHLHPQIPSV